MACCSNEASDDNSMEFVVPLLINAGFYSPCQTHKSNRATFFCWQCKGKAFCQTCKNSQHVHHQNVVQVYKASHSTAFRTARVQSLLDLSEIHNFSFNGHSIVFLFQRSSSGSKRHIISKLRSSNDSKKRRTYNSQCQECGRDLSSNNFCSIECKHKAKERLGVEESSISQSNSSTPAYFFFPKLTGVKDLSSTPPSTYKKRSRKGTPIRSPLF